MNLKKFAVIISVMIFICVSTFIVFFRKLSCSDFETLNWTNNINNYQFYTRFKIAEVSWTYHRNMYFLRPIVNYHVNALCTVATANTKMCQA